MKNYCALLINNIVSDVIVADYAWATANLVGDWFDLGGEPLTVAVGYIYDTKTGQFVPPPKPEI